MIRLPTKPWIAALFAACCLYFLSRGPYRAIRYQTTGDFSTVYAAARCWLDGSNPYDRDALKRALAAGGAPSDLQLDQDKNPSVYLLSAMPLAAAVAWLPWPLANASWCVLELAAFATALAALLRRVALPSDGRWILASLCLLYSPTYVGIYNGNPSVLVISLLTLSLCGPSPLLSAGIMTGIALAFKPQLAVCALVVFALWRHWRSLGLACAVFSILLAAGILATSHGGRDWAWWATEQANFNTSFLPGAPSDPSPHSPYAWQMLHLQTLTSYLFTNSNQASAAAGLFTALMAAWYLLYRKAAWWQDVAIMSLLTLMVTYHRYYDGQLVLLTLPYLSRVEEKKIRRLAAACLAALVFPLESNAAKWLGARATEPSFLQLAALRFQPAAVCALAAILVWSNFSQSRAKRNSYSNEAR